MSDYDQNMVTDEETGDIQDETWLPRRSIRDTNWMYRVDTLRTHDHREMEVQVHHSLALLCNAVQALAYAFTFRYTVLHGSMATLRAQFDALYESLLQIVYLFLSESYCCFIDYLQIAYYPLRNRITSQNIGVRFPPIVRKKINDLGYAESYQLTGLSPN